MRFIDVSDENLIFGDTAVPSISEDECLIKVMAIGINRADLLQRAGKYPPPKGESPILGLEVAGVIEKVGSKVSGFKLGESVYGLVAGGGYAEYVNIHALHVMKMPDHFSYPQGAATAEVFLTAFQSLFTIAQLQPKQSVLIHAGASGVGSAAIQLAKAMNCFVVTTTGSAIKADTCIRLGANKAINYQTDDFVEICKKEYPQGFDVILDVVAGNYINKNIDLAAVDGKIVMLSILGGRFSEPVDAAKMLMKRVQITASTLRNRSIDYKTELITAFNEQFSQQLACESIMPVIDTVYSWQQAEQAHQKMSKNENIGKLVLVVD